jgi:uncharacterized protein (TIGR02996 family)
MTADHLPFLRAVMANPDDDLPRLVFADWLDENGQPERAEFIRLQIDRHHRGVTALHPREEELVRAHGADWLEHLPAGCDDLSFRRGFVHRLRCHARHLFDRDAPLLAPVEELTVVVNEVRTEWLAVEPAAPLALPLCELVVDCREPVGGVLLTVLRRFGPFPRLNTLRLRDPVFGWHGAGQLHPDATFPAVTVLDLSGCGVGDGGAEALAENGWAGRLTALVLRDNPISDGRRAWLRHRFGDRLVL